MRRWFGSQTTFNKVIIVAAAAILIAGVVGYASRARAEVCTDLGGGILRCGESGTTLVRTGGGTVIVIRDENK